MKTVRSNIISHNQAAFMLGRSILHNVLVSHEILHGYNTATVSPRGLLKIDI